jgi:hypothetical protein
VKVHLAQIPQGSTLRVEGTADPSFLDLEAANARALGPLVYSLDVGLSEGGLFATGSLRIPVELTCVVTLDPFPSEIVIDPFAIQKELDGREVVDLSEEIREDIQLALPAYPRREAGSGGIGLPGNSAPPDDRPTTDERWKALEKLKPDTD